MRILFLNHEQYTHWRSEPGNLELRLPIIYSRADIEFADFVYQRYVRKYGISRATGMVAEKIADFRPDIVVYSPTWPKEDIDVSVLGQAMKDGITVYVCIWDTVGSDMLEQRKYFSCAHYISINDSVTHNKILISEMNRYPQLLGVLFPGGNMVFTDIIRKANVTKLYDVCILGSSEGRRIGLYSYLKNELIRDDIHVYKMGGLNNAEKTDDSVLRENVFLSPEYYCQVINQARICLSSQTAECRCQIKGKIFHYLACEAFCLVDNNPEIRKVIPDGCVVYYDDEADCCYKIRQYICDEPHMQMIARAGYSWFRCNYDYHRYWRETLNKMLCRIPFTDL